MVAGLNTLDAHKPKVPITSNELFYLSLGMPAVAKFVVVYHSKDHLKSCHQSLGQMTLTELNECPTGLTDKKSLKRSLTEGS